MPFTIVVAQVQLMVDSEVEVSAPSPAPTGDDYVGCFSDMVSDRVMTSVLTSDDLTPEVKRYYNTSYGAALHA